MAGVCGCYLAFWAPVGPIVVHRTGGYSGKDGQSTWGGWLCHSIDDFVAVGTPRSFGVQGHFGCAEGDVSMPGDVVGSWQGGGSSSGVSVFGGGAGHGAV